MSSSKIDVAIVGGGVAGTALLIELASKAPAGYRVAVFERSDVGPGTAYQPQSASLLLNGPVRAMSIVPGDERHFERWLVDEPADALICRARYGSYARASAAATLAARRDFAHVRANVVDVEQLDDHRFEIVTSGGSRYHASSVVLALGNFAPADGFLPAELRTFPGYFRDPWRADVRECRAGDVVLLGSRLTAMDVIALLEECAFRGRIHLVSRHGLIPYVEDPKVRGADPATLDLDSSSPHALLRSMRRAAMHYAGDWRAVVDSIRKISPAIWESWSVRDRKRFLRHAQALWAVHRYRVPAATYAAFARLRAQGRVINHRGHIDAATIDRDQVDIRIRNAHGTAHVRASYAINCTGPNADLTTVDDVLVQRLLQRGLVRGDRLRLGLDVDEGYRALDANGVAHDDIFAMGPLLRGRWYETTAIPEITRHAAAIAHTLLTGRNTMMVAG